jgi:hypothetical protein
MRLAVKHHISATGGVYEASPARRSTDPAPRRVVVPWDTRAVVGGDTPDGVSVVEVQRDIAILLQTLSMSAARA